MNLNKLFDLLLAPPCQIDCAWHGHARLLGPPSSVSGTTVSTLWYGLVGLMTSHCLNDDVTPHHRSIAQIQTSPNWSASLPCLNAVAHA